MKHLFSKHEMQFIFWFCGIFLLSIALLAALGLVPAEFKFGGGETFEQKTRNSIRQIIDGTLTNPSGAAGNNTNQIGLTPGTKTQITGARTNGVGTSGSNRIPTEIKTAAGETIYAEEPIRLVIPSIGVDTIVKNPTSTNYETLDAELTKGVVRYPGSGYPGLGNMFLFGHSTGFSIVQNQAYKVFNKLKYLENGATINIYGELAVYEYRVTSLKKVDKDHALVSFNTNKNIITLSTCDSFGKATDRYIVEGDLVSVKRR